MATTSMLAGVVTDDDWLELSTVVTDKGNVVF